MFEAGRLIDAQYVKGPVIADLMEQPSQTLRVDYYNVCLIDALNPLVHPMKYAEFQTRKRLPLRDFLRPCREGHPEGGYDKHLLDVALCLHDFERLKHDRCLAQARIEEKPGTSLTDDELHCVDLVLMGLPILTH
jgi:hypothetical protein